MSMIGREALLLRVFDALRLTLVCPYLSTLLCMTAPSSLLIFKWLMENSTQSMVWCPRICLARATLFSYGAPQLNSYIHVLSRSGNEEQGSARAR